MADNLPSAGPSAVPVDVATVSDGKDQHYEHVIADLVDDPVVPGADPPLTVTAYELRRASRTRIPGQEFDRCLDATACGRI